MNRRLFLVSLGAWVIAGCGGGDEEVRPTATSTRPPRTAVPTRTPAASPTPKATATIEPTATATATPAPGPRLEPIGFPLDPSTRTGLVVGAAGSRTIAWGEGPTALEYSRDEQPSSDPEWANRCGWNARVHVEYEANPAVDWYVPIGTPVVATMDGTATLLINTVSNPFDVYGVEREAFLGNPDRTRARPGMFPGPGGGQGVFVRIVNDLYRTDYAHFEIGPTVAVVPDGAWIDGYGAGDDFASAFAALRDFRVASAVANWQVRAGDVIGFSGDSGYSEAPHLHYAIRPAGSNSALCPTTEVGFEDGGWLFRAV